MTPPLFFSRRPHAANFRKENNAVKERLFLAVWNFETDRTANSKQSDIIFAFSFCQNF